MLGNLTPKDDLKISVYDERLDEAINNNMANIAITGAYGIGKSSVIESYLKRRENKYPCFIRAYNLLASKIKTKSFNFNFFQKIKDYDVIAISNLITLNGSQEEITDSLQKNIITNLLTDKKPSDYPKSRFSRIGRHSSALMFLIVFILFYVLLSVHIKNVYKLIDKHTILSTVILTYAFMKIFDFICENRLKVKVGVNSHGITSGIELDNIKITDPFLQKNDELKYYFKKSHKKIIVFQDLDRFNSPLIFQKLHELNDRINRNLENKVIFIYELDDSLFADNKANYFNHAERRNKFFDVILPIQPNKNLQTSILFFEEQGRESPAFYNNSASLEPIIRNVSLFITDMRTIKTIISEYDIAFKIIRSTNIEEINCKKLFGIVVYKNIFFPDYNKTSKKSSDIEQFCKLQQKIRQRLDEIKATKNLTMTEFDEFERDFPNWGIDKVIRELNYEDADYLSHLSEEEKKLIELFLDRDDLVRYLAVNNLLDYEAYSYLSPFDYFTNLDSQDTKFVRKVLSRKIPGYRGAPTDTHSEYNVTMVLDKIGADFSYARSVSLPRYLINTNREVNINRAFSIIQRAVEDKDYLYLINVLWHDRENYIFEWLLEKHIFLFKESELFSEYIVIDKVIKYFDEDSGNISKKLFNLLEESGILEQTDFKKRLINFFQEKGSFTILQKYKHRYSDLSFVKDKVIREKLEENGWSYFNSRE